MYTRMHTYKTHTLLQLHHPTATKASCVSGVTSTAKTPKGVEGLAHQTNMLMDVPAGDEGNHTHQ